MGDNISSESDVSTLKHTLCAQQNLLQKLYNELDAEREASASAASEALSVILRLQGEKAAVKMEAEQYKRLAEEKMSHAEESLAIIEDIIYQKEMEVSALDCQVQAYRYKLLSMGCVDLGVGPFQENKDLGRETSFQGGRRRDSSKYENAVNARDDDSCLEEIDMISNHESSDRASDSDNKTDNSIDSYLEQIRKLDVRVKEIAGVNCTNNRIEKQPPSPQTSITDSYHQNKLAIVNENNEIKGHVDYYPCSPSVHDVFEVPQIDRNISCCESRQKDENETAGKNIEAVEEKMFAGYEHDWLKKVLKSTHCERQLRETSYNTSIECRLAIVGPTTSVSESQPGLCRLNGTSEIVEAERPSECINRDEELKLLNEIKAQLDSLCEEIRGRKVEKSPKRDEPSLCALSEAMLYFWL